MIITCDSFDISYLLVSLVKISNLSVFVKCAGETPNNPTVDGWIPKHLEFVEHVSSHGFWTERCEKDMYTYNLYVYNNIYIYMY